MLLPHILLRLKADGIKGPTLFRALLSYPGSDPSRAGKEISNIPHIERLCSILVDVNFHAPDVSRSHSEDIRAPPELLPQQAAGLRDSVLAFFNMLAVAHSDALTILVESLTLIPSLVLYLTRLVTPFREDDWQLMQSPPRTAT